MKLPFATPGPSRRPSEAGSHVGGSDPEAPEHPWGLVLSQFTTVARHDPRSEVSCVDAVCACCLCLNELWITDFTVISQQLSHNVCDSIT